MSQSTLLALSVQYLPLWIALQLLGISRPTLNKLIKDGHIKAVVLPGMKIRRIPAKSLLDYLGKV